MIFRAVFAFVHRGERPLPLARCNGSGHRNRELRFHPHIHRVTEADETERRLPL